MQRKENYQKISKALESLSQEEIQELLSSGEKIHIGIGGTAVKLEIESIPVFAKKIPLTEIDMQNEFSTKNLFNLPTYYQYGVGSTGFGAWRELKAHEMTTQWVIDEECENFPIMYNYKIVQENNPQNMDQEKLEKYVSYWGGSEAIENRMKSLHDSKHSVVVFLEFIPYTLKSYKINLDANMIERDLIKTVNFMAKKGMIHFDGHYRNILTDGQKLYFADYGLATSLEFDLSEAEVEFFHRHKRYDLAHGLFAISHNSPDAPEMPADIKALQDKYQSASERYYEFIKSLRLDETKSIIYPEEELLILTEDAYNDFEMVGPAGFEPATTPL